jgi:heterotetrameric sarcosine oxidase gamma subunit
MAEPTGSRAIAAVRRRVAISCARIAIRSPLAPDHAIFKCKPLHYLDSGSFAVMGVWPGSWLLISDTVAPAQLVACAEELADCENSLVVDVSDLYEVFDIEGPSAREIIASGCAVDFEIAPPPMVVPTRLSHFDVVVAFSSWESFRILVPRSFADDLEAWLNRAAKCSSQPDLNGTLS